MTTIFPGKGNGAIRLDSCRLVAALVMIVISGFAWSQAEESSDAFDLGWSAFESGHYREAMHYWMPLAERGDTNAQLNIGYMYEAGQGAEADLRLAAYWYRRAAENGHAAAQYNLGLMYRDGSGVTRDLTHARHWIERAAGQGLQAARATLNAGLDVADETDSIALPRDEFLDSLAGMSTGTGWLVAGGYVVTSNHVVADVSTVTLYDNAGESYSAVVTVRDMDNDIALMRIRDDHKLPAALRLAPASLRTGSDVFTLGYPRVDVLGRTLKLSTGVISSVNGFRDDPHRYQTSVQIQPGNSGGPLFNMRGEVVGIVAAMLGNSTVTSATEPGLSYAVKVEHIQASLDTVSDTPSVTSPLSAGTAPLADLVERLQPAIMLVIAEN